MTGDCFASTKLSRKNKDEAEDPFYHRASSKGASFSVVNSRPCLCGRLSVHVYLRTVVRANRRSCDKYD